MILTVNAEGLCHEEKGYDFQVRGCWDNTTTKYIPILIYEISCKLLADFKNFQNFVTKLCITMLAPTYYPFIMNLD